MDNNVVTKDERMIMETEMMHVDDPDNQAVLTYLDETFCGKDEQFVTALQLGKRTENGYCVCSVGKTVEGKLGVVFDGQSALLLIPRDGSAILEYLPDFPTSERWQESGWKIRG